MSRSETPVSLKVPRHHPAVGKSNRSFNSNSRSNPRTTTRRNKPRPSPRGGRAPTYLDDAAASIGRRLNASRSRTFAPPLQSSSRFPCRPRTAFGTPAACRNAPAPASRLPALGPMLRSETSRRTARRAPRRGQFRTANGPSRPPTNGGAAQILYSKTGPREIQKAGSKRRCLRARRGIIHGEQTSRWACASILIWAALGSDFGRNVTLNRFQTRGCCAKRACCITVQHHDQPESW